MKRSPRKRTGNLKINQEVIQKKHVIKVTFSTSFSAELFSDMLTMLTQPPLDSILLPGKKYLMVKKLPIFLREVKAYGKTAQTMMKSEAKY